MEYDYEYGEAFSEDFSYNGVRSSHHVRRPADPLYYHKRVAFTERVKETPRAVLLRLTDGLTVWVPKSVCRHWQPDSVWVHRATFERSLQTARQYQQQARVSMSG